MIQHLDFSLDLYYRRRRTAYFGVRVGFGTTRVDRNVNDCIKQLVKLPSATHLTLRPVINLVDPDSDHPFDGILVVEMIATSIEPLAAFVKNLDIAYDERVDGLRRDFSSVQEVVIGEIIYPLSVPSISPTGKVGPSGHDLLIEELQKQVSSLQAQLWRSSGWKK